MRKDTYLIDGGDMKPSMLRAIWLVVFRPSRFVAISTAYVEGLSPIEREHTKQTESQSVAGE